MWIVNVEVDRDVTSFTNWSDLAKLFSGQKDPYSNTTFRFVNEAQARGFAAEAEIQDERPEVVVFEEDTQFNPDWT